MLAYSEDLTVASAPIASARILFLSDTHLGLDLPAQPRVQRRRRGDDFFRAYEQALEPAFRGEVALVLHGGDLLYRSQVAAELVGRAFQPLKRLAEQGIPVVVVPGNHERSQIPYPILAAHRGITILDSPASLTLRLGGLNLCIAGFPYVRENVRDQFSRLVQQALQTPRGTGSAQSSSPDARLLVVHHCIEGATVGPVGYMFRSGEDVIPARALPADFAAILSGHIHRHQVLTRDRQGRPLPVPVLYPGSTERTSPAEKDEAKGYLLLTVQGTADGRGRLSDWTFVPLPTRPMLQVDFDPAPERGSVEERLRQLLGSVHPDAVLYLRIRGRPALEHQPLFRAAHLRSMIAPSVNLHVTFPELRGATRESDDHGDDEPSLFERPTAPE